TRGRDAERGLRTRERVHRRRRAPDVRRAPAPRADRALLALDHPGGRRPAQGRPHGRHPRGARLRRGGSHGPPRPGDRGMSFTRAPIDAEPYDEFGMLPENSAELGLDGPITLSARRVDVEVLDGEHLSAIVWGDG